MGADFQPFGADVDSLGRKGVHLFQKSLGIKHHAVADDAYLARVQDTGGDDMQNVLLAVHNNSVPCVVSALETHHKIDSAAEQIDDLALAFIAPLRSDHGNIAHLPLLGRPQTAENLRHASERTRKAILIRAFGKGVNHRILKALLQKTADPGAPEPYTPGPARTSSMTSSAMSMRAGISLRPHVAKPEYPACHRPQTAAHHQPAPARLSRHTASPPPRVPARR